MAQKFCLILCRLILISIEYRAVSGEVSLTDFFPYSTNFAGVTSHGFSDETEIHLQLQSSVQFINKTYWSVTLHSNGWLAFRDQGGNQRERICGLCLDGINRDDSLLTSFHTTDESSSAMQKARKEILSKFRNLKSLKFNYIFSATWYNLGGYNLHSHMKDTFQITLVSTADNQGKSHTFVILFYNKIMWGTPAAEFRNDQQVPIYQLNNDDILNPGRYIYKVDATILMEIKCDHATSPDMITSIPMIVPVWGNIPLILEGICLQSRNTSVKCNFRDPSKSKPLQSIGSIVNDRPVCHVPYLYSLGKILLDIIVKEPGQPAIIHETHVYAVKESDFESGIDKRPNIFLNETHQGSFLLIAEWDMEEMKIEMMEEIVTEENLCHKNGTVLFVHVILLEYDGFTWSELGALTPPFVNNGVIVTTFNMTRYQELIGNRKKVFVRNFALKTIFSLASEEGTLYKVVPSNLANGMKTFIKLESLRNNKFDALCKNWYNNEPPPSTDALLCPLHLNQAMIDWRFSLDLDSAIEDSTNLTISSTYLQKVPSASGACTKCIYDAEGKLNVRHSRYYQKSPSNLRDHWAHFWSDMLPYLFCSFSNDKDSLSLYEKKRPSISTYGNYSFPLIARAVGQGHITTFTGINYTFMATGEYQMISYSSDNHHGNDFAYTHGPSSHFRMHIGIALIRSSGQPVISYAGMEQKFKGETIRVTVFIDPAPDHMPVLSVTVDKVSVTLAQFKSNFYYPGLVITHKSSHEAILNFASGFSFLVQAELQWATINIIAMADPKLNQSIEGLWGYAWKNHDQIQNFKTLVNDSNEKDSLSETYDFAQFYRVTVKEDSLLDLKDFILLSELNVASEPVQANWYADFNSTEEILLKSSSNDSIELCSGDKECEFDIAVLPWRNKYAKATKIANTIFQELRDTENFKIKACPVPITGEGNKNFKFEAESFFVGSILSLECFERFEIDTGVRSVEFQCEENKNDDKASWVNPSVGKLTDNFSCKPVVAVVGGNAEKSSIIVDKEEKSFNETKIYEAKESVFTPAAKAHSHVAPSETENEDNDSNHVGTIVTVAIIVVLLLGVVVGVMVEYSPFRWRGQLIRDYI